MATAVRKPAARSPGPSPASLMDSLSNLVATADKLKPSSAFQWTATDDEPTFDNAESTTDVDLSVVDNAIKDDAELTTDVDLSVVDNAALGDNAIKDNAKLTTDVDLPVVDNAALVDDAESTIDVDLSFLDAELIDVLNAESETAKTTLTTVTKSETAETTSTTVAKPAVSPEMALAQPPTIDAIVADLATRPSARYDIFTGKMLPRRVLDLETRVEHVEQQLESFAVTSPTVSATATKPLSPPSSPPPTLLSFM